MENTLTENTPTLPGGSEAWWLLTRAADLGRTLVVCATDEAAQNLFDDHTALARWKSPESPPTARFFSEEEEERLAALSAWSGPDASANLLIASLDSLTVPLPAPGTFFGDHQKVSLGDRTNRDEFFGKLMNQGYERVDTVEKIGEVAVRGEVMDLWSPGWEGPLRLLWPFDQIESLRKIDLNTQRSTDEILAEWVRPARLKDEGHTLLDFLKDGTLFESRLPPGAAPARDGRRVVHAPLESTAAAPGYEPVPPFAGRADLLARSVAEWLATGWRVLIFCHNAGEQERVEELLLEQDRGLAEAFETRRIDLPLGHLVHGFLDPGEKRAVLSNGEIFGRIRRRLRLPKFVGGASLGQIAELKKDDYVVHGEFGIGRYVGLERKNAGGVEMDYLRLEYRGGDRVFVPLFEFRQVKKYIGVEGKRPKLSSLDTATWDRTKAEVEEAVAQLAKDLLARAAARTSRPGYAFPPDSHMEKEFAASFVYDLTPDQARAIEETKRDMMRPMPMDRLVCGDVGYGKTEVAMRAALKAVSAGKQVALLVPTTILAEQHGRNFRDRFADYPVSVAVLSRFSAPAERKRVIQDVRRGVIDIIVGTHALLSPEVVFKDLGLLIIDEEHRFGVKQKERFLAFRDVVDVLALSATPIPRTMGSALGGLKALSVIETPPEGRLPIQTHLGPFNREVVIPAVEQELRRGGQVYYVHNRVGSIEKRKEWLEKTLAEHGLPAKIVIAHGQMTGPALEKVMWDFLHRKFDILLATSIIESGLDIPSVNTLIVEEAEDFGLAQLYQLRGRVGRERQRAYCYLFYSSDAALTDDAQKRLSALKEFASLGAGFRLAMRDLEIRGAGNLLGAEQSGHLNAIGVDLYGQLLSEEIERQKQGGGPAGDGTVETALELPVSAYLSAEVLPSEADRVVFYKRLLDAGPGDLEGLRAELEDRCGRLPPEAERLFAVTRLRQTAQAKKVVHVGLVEDGLEFRFREGTALAAKDLARLMAAHGDRFRFLPPTKDTPPGMRFEPPLPPDLVDWSTAFLDQLSLDTAGQKS